MARVEQPFSQIELKLLFDAVSIELYDLDVTCNRAVLLMGLQHKLEILLEGE